MSLKERVMHEMKEAMKAREAGKQKLSVLRLALAAIKNREIELGKPLSDEQIQEVIAKEVKQRREAIVEYQKAGRDDMVRSLNQEIDILMSYLPQQLTEEEIRKILQEAIIETRAAGISDLGKVMSLVMPKVKGRADGKLVNSIARQLLE